MGKSGKSDSRLSGFYRKSRGERLDSLKDACALPVDQLRILSHDGALPFDLANLFVENAVGSHPLPLGIATNIQVNGRDYAVPFAVEESSVIAAASNAAKWVRNSGGFFAECLGDEMIGQIQILDIAPEKFARTEELLRNGEATLLETANQIHPRLLMRGGGARSFELRKFPDAEIPFLVLHVHLDTREAMGANLVNTVCERLAPVVEKITGGRVGLRILSNLADRRLFRTKCQIDVDALRLDDPEKSLTGDEVAQRIVEAYVFAKNDPYRAATHNKGIMNGIDPVVIATGNDWRAVEAGAHAYAAREGRYQSLSRWSFDREDGLLFGELTIPMQLGTVGGVTRLHPSSKTALQILGNPGTEELGKIIVSAGLASNLAALRALVSTGIQRGHMKLHAKNLALAAGALAEEVEAVAMEMVFQKNVSASSAETILAQLRTQKALLNNPGRSRGL
jgi:hydroxymethylglutaryl-CoA reductase